MNQRFSDRRDAGRKLGRALLGFAARRPLVLALPRGGVPVGYEVACCLGTALQPFIVRRIGLPDRRALPLGAVASGGIQVFFGELLRRLEVRADAFDGVIREEMRVLAKREALYGTGYAPPQVRGRTVILVTDALRPDLTMLAALRAIRQQRPACVVVAAPVGAREAVAIVASEADEVICLKTTDSFGSAGEWYDCLDYPSDTDVRDLLDRARRLDRMAG